MQSASGLTQYRSIRQGLLVSLSVEAVIEFYSVILPVYYIYFYARGYVRARHWLILHLGSTIEDVKFLISFFVLGSSRLLALMFLQISDPLQKRWGRAPAT